MSVALKAGLAIILMVIILVIVLPLILRVAGISVFNGSTRAANRSGTVLMIRSDDNGDRWQSVSIPQDKSAPVSQILDIAFHPSDPDKLFMGTRGGGLWQSSDAGRTWRKSNDSSRVLAANADVFQIALSAADQNIMYLGVFQGGRGRVLKSDNGGLSFREVYFIVSDTIAVFDVYADPSDANHVVIATGQGGVLVSSDGGATWRVAKWFTEPVTRLAVNPSYFDEIYAITGNGKLNKTFDGGENWIELNPGAGGIDNVGDIQGFGFPQLFFGAQAPRNLIAAFAADASDFTHAYAGLQDGLFGSTNGGFTWSRINTPVSPASVPITAVAVHPLRSMTLFAGVSSQLYRSEDMGVNWAVRSLPTSLVVHGLVLHPLRPEILFAILGTQ